jgi:hypothetical protein
MLAVFGGISEPISNIFTNARAFGCWNAIFKGIFHHTSATSIHLAAFEIRVSRAEVAKYGRNC